MSLLSNIQFFEVRQSAKREKNFGECLRSQFQKRKNETRLFQSKVERIKQTAKRINERLNADNG